MNGASREMSLGEYVSQLAPTHAARVEYRALADVAAKAPGLRAQIVQLERARRQLELALRRRSSIVRLFSWLEDQRARAFTWMARRLGD